MDRVTEFLEAVKQGDANQVAAMILSHPDLVQSAGQHGKTGLHWAAELDHIDIAKLMVDAGADVLAKTTWGASPLEWAAWMGSARVADFLLSLGAGRLTLMTAAALGRLRELEEIVEPGINLSSHRRKDASIVADDHWPVDSAHIQGDILSDALYAAARNGHTQVVEYLLERGANIDAKGVFGGTGLHWAAINGHAETVELLISRGANLSLKDARFGATAEGWAEEGGHSEIAVMLRRAAV